MRKAQLAKISVRLEIRPEAGAEILQRATDFRGKVFHEFCRFQQTFRGNQIPGAVGRTGLRPSVSD